MLCYSTRLRFLRKTILIIPLSYAHVFASVSVKVVRYFYLSSSSGEDNDRYLPWRAATTRSGRVLLDGYKIY